MREDSSPVTNEPRGSSAEKFFMGRLQPKGAKIFPHPWWISKLHYSVPKSFLYDDTNIVFQETVLW